MDNNETYNWAPDDPGKKKNKPNLKKLGGKLLLILLAFLVASSAMSCFYTVDDKQQAVVTTFGKVTDITDAGVHFKIPFGIQQVRKVDVNVYQKIELGYDSGYDGICSDCRTCQFHRPLWTKQSCVFSACPYSSNHLSTKKKDLKKEHRIAGKTGVMHM